MTVVESAEYLLPEIILSVGAMVLLIVGVWRGGDSLKGMTYASVGLLAVAMAVSITGAGSDALVFGNSFAMDGFTDAGRLLIYGAAIVSLLLSIYYLRAERLGKFEYPVLVILACAGMGLMVSAHDLIAVYMGVELQSLALYILATFNRESLRSTEAGLKYFVLGALSSGVLLYGMSLVYGATGALDFATLANAVDNSGDMGLTFGMVFVMAGLAFKISAAPFHMWTPDVYEGAPTPVTAFFAGAPKVAGMFLFVRFLYEALPALFEMWQPIVWMLSALSMVVGSVFALVQTNIKRLMAYSSIGHVGYALMGVAAGGVVGVEAVVLYLAIYVITTLGVFACILSMRREEGMAENIEDLAGLVQSRPGLGVAFTLLLLSLAGIPPLLGFFGKLAVFTAAMSSGLIILTLIGVVTSVISLVYYLSIVKTIWFAEPGPGFVVNRGAAVTVSASVSALLVTIGLVILLRPLFALASGAAVAIL